MYSNNPRFGWLKCTFQALEDRLSKKKQEARENMGKDVTLNVGDRRFFQVEIISVGKGSDHDLNTPLSYQKYENSVENSCVWLATCLVTRLVDEPLAEVLLKKYHDEPQTIEWLYMFNKGAPNWCTPFNYLQWTEE